MIVNFTHRMRYTTYRHIASPDDAFQNLWAFLSWLYFWKLKAA